MPQVASHVAPFKCKGRTGYQTNKVSSGTEEKSLGRFYPRLAIGQLSSGLADDLSSPSCWSRWLYLPSQSFTGLGVFCIVHHRTIDTASPLITTSLWNKDKQYLAEYRLKSLVVPIAKSSEQSSPSNYRPISLLSILSKALERHMYWVISSHLIENSTLCDAQWGFSPGKGTVTALLATTHQWLKLLEDRKDVCAVFFDFY